MAAGFNFNNIQLSSSADVSKIMENFNKIETDGIKYSDAKALATTSANGIMSSTDKTKLDGIAAGAQANNITTVKFNNVTQTISNKTLSLNETDPTVPDWAKAANKPSYEWEEIGDKPTITTQSTITNFWYGTEAQYNALSSKSSTTLYLIQEED